MSESARVLKRLEDALDFNRQRKLPSVTVAVRDLEWVLHHFKRMDAQDRAHYPQHVEMLVDAALDVARNAGQASLTKQGMERMDALRRALDYSKPDWRTDARSENRKAEPAERDV